MELEGFIYFVSSGGAQTNCLSESQGTLRRAMSKATNSPRWEQEIRKAEHGRYGWDVAETTADVVFALRLVR